MFQKTKKPKFGTLFVMEYTFTTNFHIWAQGPPRAPGPTLPPPPKVPNFQKTNNPKFQKTNKPKFQKTKKPRFGIVGCRYLGCHNPKFPKFGFLELWFIGFLVFLNFGLLVFWILGTKLYRQSHTISNNPIIQSSKKPKNQ